MVAVSRGQKRKALAAIDRFEESRVQQVKRIGRFRIGVNFAEIPRALPETAVVIYARPFLASVVGSKETTFLCLDGCVNAI